MIGMHFIKNGHRVAVIPIDPSSHKSGGSLLGDSTRMPNLSKQNNCFIRPSPTKGLLGGLAKYTTDVITLCEITKYDIILLESVGLGQSEVEIEQAVDMLILLLSPGGGDDLQASKKGITESADLILITKADGDLIQTANQMKSEYTNSISFQRMKSKYWTTRVLLMSINNKSYITTIIHKILEYKNIINENDNLKLKRAEQAKYWMWTIFQRNVLMYIMSDNEIKNKSQLLLKSLENEEITPGIAASRLFEMFTKLKSE
jgi:LAO/AO transport system kinase